MPVFVHDESDLQTFRMITSQFYINGNATQAEICRAFGVPSITVKRAVKNTGKKERLDFTSLGEHGVQVY